MVRNFKYKCRPTLPVRGRFPSLEVISAGFQSGPSRMLLSRPARPTVVAACGGSGCQAWLGMASGLACPLPQPRPSAWTCRCHPHPVQDTVGACPVPSTLTPTWPGLSCRGRSYIGLPAGSEPLSSQPVHSLTLSRTATEPAGRGPQCLSPAAGTSAPACTARLSSGSRDAVPWAHFLGRVSLSSVAHKISPACAQPLGL